MWACASDESIEGTTPLDKDQPIYGSQEDTDFSFLEGMTVIQVCVGENETILNLPPPATIMIASEVKVTSPQGTSVSLSNQLNKVQRFRCSGRSSRLAATASRP